MSVVRRLPRPLGAIAAIWIGPRTGSSPWLVMALPQVSIALLAVLIGWTPKSRPQQGKFITDRPIPRGLW